MTKPKHFGTDGIRGVANEGMLSPEQQLRLGRSLGRFALRHGTKVVVARDPRRSSSMIVAALSAGIASEGADVLDLGPLPTPALAALIPYYHGSLGVMVSASHNPMRDNGVKILSHDGAKMADVDELELERELEIEPSTPVPTGAAVGAIARAPDPSRRYIDYLLAAFPDLRLDGLRLVIDGANGATADVAPRLFRQLGADVIECFTSPNGLNINENCGAVHPGEMARIVKEQKGDLGIAFDGDGDRLIMVGGDGSIQDGDCILYVCAAHQMKQGGLAQNTLVGTVMSNFGFELALRDLGVRLVRTPVGDRHVAVAMRENKWELGGEPSGHLLFGERNRLIGDGIFSALVALSVIRAEGKPLHELSAPMKPVPQELINIAVRSRPPIDTLAHLPAKIVAAEQELGGDGRVLIRYSGTENLLRVMVEGSDAAMVSRLATELVNAAAEEIGVAEPTP